jgi:hypothetical protein
MKRPRPIKKSGWKGKKNDTFYTKSTQYGVKYQCKGCGKIALGIGGSRHNHWTWCAHSRTVEPVRTKTGVGLTVLYCGHNGYFKADIYAVGNALVVRAPGKIDGGTLLRGDTFTPTHHLSDCPQPGFWRPDLGVFVVPEDQVKLI